MKTFALSICALSGALMASAGTVAEQMDHARRFNNLDSVGMTIAILASLATLYHAFKST